MDLFHFLEWKYPVKAKGRNYVIYQSSLLSQHLHLALGSAIHQANCCHPPATSITRDCASQRINLPVGCFKVNDIFCEGRKPVRNCEWISFLGEVLLGMKEIQILGWGYAVLAMTQRTAVLQPLWPELTHICQLWVHSNFSGSMNKSFGYQTTGTKNLEK